MIVDVHVHLEPTPEGAVWWSETPGFHTHYYATADSLAGLREHWAEALAEFSDVDAWREILVDDEGNPTTQVTA